VIGRKESIGRVTWLDSDFWPIDTAFYVRPLRPVNLRWLFHLLSSLGLERLATGSAIPGLDRDDIYQVRVDLPEAEVQHRWAAALDACEALLRRRRLADEHAERLLPACFRSHFGDPDAVGTGMRRVPLGSILEPVEPRAAIRFQGRGLRYVSSAELDSRLGLSSAEPDSRLGRSTSGRSDRMDFVGIKSAQVIKSRDVLLAGGTKRSVASAIVPPSLDGHLCALDIHVLRVRTGLGFGYLYTLTRLDWFREHMSGDPAGASRLRPSTLGIATTVVPMPTQLEGLRRFDRIVLRVVDLQNTRLRCSARLEDIKRTLSARAFPRTLGPRAPG
jgi:hypothetical protein